MKKSDLKTGMALEFESGRRAMVLRNASYYGGRDIMWYEDHSFDFLRSLDDNLEMLYNGRVVKILELQITEPLKKWNHVLWERPENQSIEIDVRINGKRAKLSDLSKETLDSLRDNN